MTTSPTVSSVDVAFETKWGIESPSTTMFDFDYTGGRDQLLRLYDKGTRRQWIGSDRLDWTQEVDLNNPVGMPDELLPIFGTPWWDDMSEERKGEFRRHVEAWRFSQFMHGEQGALICTAKIVQTVPDIDSKFYAATQVIDEARHVEVYSRYLHEKLQLVYPLNVHLKALLDDVIADSRWDMTYLGMQVLIEGLALAAFGIIRNNATDPLAKALNAYVMQDEARHVMFGRLALRDYYPQLSQAERDEREEFALRPATSCATASWARRFSSAWSCRPSSPPTSTRATPCASSATSCSCASCPSCATSACGVQSCAAPSSRWG